MTTGRPLVVVDDETLLDEVLRMAAAAGCVVDHAPDLVGARPKWSTASLVIIGENEAMSEHGLPTRRGVALVCKASPSSEVWRRAFVGSVERVYVLPEDEAEMVGAFADLVEGTDGPSGHVVGVVGGRGGAGASILAAGLGVAVSRSGGSGLLVDCDPLGGGIDLVLGAEREEGVRWPELKVSAGRVAMAALRDALPCVRRGRGGGELSFVSCDREGDGPHPAAVAAVLEAGRRAGRTVVCDLPRDLAGGALAAVDRADLVILVVPAEVRACVAARRLFRRLADRTTAIGVVARGPSPDDLAPRVVAEAVGAPLLAAMDAERALARGLERGVFEPKPGGPLSAAADTVLAALLSGGPA